MQVLCTQSTTSLDSSVLPEYAPAEGHVEGRASGCE